MRGLQLEREPVERVARLAARLRGNGGGARRRKILQQGLEPAPRDGVEIGRVVPIPGASSAVSAVSAAGLAPGPFRFVGFLPSGRAERERQLRALAADASPFVLFEAPHRVRELLALMAAVLAPSRRVVLARELTKKFETIEAHKAAELATLAADERGEYVVLVDADAAQATDLDAVTRRWLEALLLDLPPARAAAVAAKASGQSRDALYRLALQLKPARS